jgi:hypothetical protein
MAFSKSMVNPCFVIFLTRSTQSSLRFLFFLRDLRALGGSFSDLEKTMSESHGSLQNILEFQYAPFPRMTIHNVLTQISISSQME